MGDLKKKRHVFTCALLLMLTLLIGSAYISMPTQKSSEGLFYINKQEMTEKPSSNKSNVFREFKDIKRTTENIFFIESRCATEKMALDYAGQTNFILNARQCCAIESTALINPEREVYVFHSCPLRDDFVDRAPEFVKRLFSYRNVHVVRLNTSQVLLGSPVHGLQEQRLLETSQYPVEHSSDILRLALLWRFGGTYADLDVITIRPLAGLKTNWAGMEDEFTIGNGVLNFEPDGAGHDMLRQALEHANAHYDPVNWSTNGPLLVTPVILRQCNVSSVGQATKNCSDNFTVYSSQILYPLYYPLAAEFFNEIVGKEIVKKVKKSSYMVHMWNKISHDLKGRVGSTQAYALLAEEFCPLVYRYCGKYF